MDTSQAAPFTVQHQATTSLTARIYRPQFFQQQLVQGKIVVQFGIEDFRTLAEDIGIPEWKLRRAARDAAISLVASITGLEASQLESDSQEDGVGTVSVKPKEGFAFPAEAN
ncbi:MAG: hypothetical protein HY577_02650 [Candidatus Nealsonbacteria bacterium]|nr:hypothetical protein [Candidatus Nealsonbacteria bacterium]